MSSRGLPAAMATADAPGARPPAPGRGGALGDKGGQVVLVGIRFGAAASLTP